MHPALRAHFVRPNPLSADWLSALAYRASGPGTIRSSTHAKGNSMNSIVYIVGAIVIVIAILSFLGLG